MGHRCHPVRAGQHKKEQSCGDADPWSTAADAKILEARFGVWLQESDRRAVVVDSSCLEAADVAEWLDSEADIVGDILGERVVGSHILVAARSARVVVPGVGPDLCNLEEVDIW